MQETTTNEFNLLPEYENPPVTEVICGVTFKQLDGFLAAHMGILWSQFQPEYPRVEEVAPLVSPIEIFEGQELEAEMEFSNVPPLPREMFISQNGNNIIQVQRDRFILNWRKVREEDSYPRYVNVIQSFQEKLSAFENFVQVGKMKLEFLQYELTYINQISQGDLWQSVCDIGNIFPKVDLSFNGSILKEPEHANWRISFVLPNRLGRLHITIRTNAVRRSDGKPVLILELTARGMSQDGSLQSRNEWFDMAREWIVKGFTDLTSTEAQNKIWKRSV